MLDDRRDPADVNKILPKITEIISAGQIWCPSPRGLDSDDHGSCANINPLNPKHTDEQSQERRGSRDENQIKRIPEKETRGDHQRKTGMERKEQKGK